MSAGQSSSRIVDLGAYRAERQAAKRRNAAPTPYVLWYPGVGYCYVTAGHVTPSVVPLAGEAALQNR